MINLFTECPELSLSVYIHWTQSKSHFERVERSQRHLQKDTAISSNSHNSRKAPQTKTFRPCYCEITLEKEPLAKVCLYSQTCAITGDHVSKCSFPLYATAECHSYAQYLIVNPPNSSQQSPAPAWCTPSCCLCRGSTPRRLRASQCSGR